MAAPQKILAQPWKDAAEVFMGAGSARRRMAAADLAMAEADAVVAEAEMEERRERKREMDRERRGNRESAKIESPTQRVCPPRRTSSAQDFVRIEVPIKRKSVDQERRPSLVRVERPQSWPGLIRDCAVIFAMVYFSLAVLGMITKIIMWDRSVDEVPGPGWWFM
ncbi:hypothetical protein WAI453_007748 [Rhynchosporium graminicola]|uniref:Uncharacterized protein n=1 Tax=Rhynchosporium graminicola TaxID=2792576 RepID=A0A1E1L2I9_9HELO|nr:uncharacterized protein RCO7_05540 [Rhynchosporium commune]